MKFDGINRVSCDVLVIGGGGAGLRAAIEARQAGADVLLVSKAKVGYANNTYIAKAIIAASGWGDPHDGSRIHLEDTIKGGRFLNDPELVIAMVKEAKAEISFLEKCGVAFAKKEGCFETEHIAGHRFPRHVRGEHRTGSDLILPLKQYAEKMGVRFVHRVFITRLFASGDRIAAASGVSHDGRFLVFTTGSVILATGGFGQVYQHTNNAAGITGDGQALALHLGLPLKDMEFVQFYPTATGRFGNRLILSEILVMVEGARLKNSKGEDIVLKHGFKDPMQLTRDRLAQAIMRELLAGNDVDGGVIMDLSPIAEERLIPLASLLPSAWHADQKTLIVSPTTHFCMGGIMIDKNAETPLPGLFAAGETTAGVHGANRLGGNALCEVFTFGSIAGKKAAVKAKEMGPVNAPGEMIKHEKARLESRFSGNGVDTKVLGRSLKQIMWFKTGILRDSEGLSEALKTISDIRSEAVEARVAKISDLIRFLELENMLLLSETVCQAALLRTESRGSHYRTDCPEEDNAHWLKNIAAKKEAGGIRLETVPNLKSISLVR
ncbi:MAG: FAD-binding protein [Deltaproteobacteria bacterium]|nr:FAD-binding protein [Deltaproteobacteria bacterium]